MAKAEPKWLGVLPPTATASDDEKGKATTATALRRLANSTESCEYRPDKVIQKRSMFITNFLSSLIKQNNKKTNQSKKNRPFLMLPPSKEESIRLALLQSERHADEKKWKPAIEALDQVLNRGVSSNKLLMQKGLLLAKMHQFKEAKTILQSLIDKKPGRSLTSDAHKALKTVNILQKEVTESNQLFLKQLRELTSKRHQNATHLPEPNQFKSGQDLSAVVRKEAALARNQQRYLLSLQLLNSGLEYGLKSDWLLHEKSLTLKTLGQFEAAEAILKDLAKTKGKRKERLAQAVDKTLQSIEEDSERFAKRKVVHVLGHFKSIATDQKWTLRHLPQKPGKRGDKEIQKLGIEEAKAALNDNNPELCLELMDAMLLYYPQNQMSQIIKARAEIELGQNKQAIEILKPMAAGDRKFARTARTLLSEIWIKTALQMDGKQSPKKAIHFFINQHLNAGINPEYTPQLDDVLMQLNSSEEIYPDPELRQHQLNLRFNGQLIELLETRLLQQNLDREPKPQRKKASSARLDDD